MTPQLAQLELAVSQAVHRARAAERALHDPGDWTLEALGRRVPCRREFHPDRIAFTGQAVLPATDHGLLLLRCGEDVIDIAEVDGGWDAGEHTLRHEILACSP